MVVMAVAGPPPLIVRSFVLPLSSPPLHLIHASISKSHKLTHLHTLKEMILPPFFSSNCVYGEEDGVVRVSMA